MSRFVLSVALVTTLAACGADAESSEDRSSQPVPEAVSSRAAAPAKVTAIPAGTVLTFEVRESVSTSSHAAGDEFSRRRSRSKDAPASRSPRAISPTQVRRAASRSAPSCSRRSVRT
jgi:hypothetical protein